KVDLAQILDTNMFNFERSATSAGWIRELEAENVGNRDEIIEHKHEHHHHEHHHHDHEHCDDPNCECHHHDHDEDHECHCHENGEECHCHDHEDGHEHHDHENHEHHHDEEHKHEHDGHHHHNDDHECHCKGHCHCGHDHNHGEEEYGIGTFVYYRRKPFDRKKFLDFINEDWGRQIIRTKGLVYFSDETEMSYLFEQAGPQKNLNQTGYWYATMPEAELKQLLEQEALLRKDWDDTYGDRMIKLVFIGQHIDKHTIVDRLDTI
ncbi:MAG: GTP-binding protein, partial [Clostridia bacterium]|nr:GTP-binding protein [Clostridia bacterium]